jgi:catechol 2,3-dioxygenase-like lactoylglutathione lyase family enzyme
VIVSSTRLSQSRVVSVLPAADFEKSLTFYRDTLGFKVETRPDMPGYAFFEGGGGSRFLLYQRPERTKAEHTTAAFLVDDVDGTVDDLRSRGVRFEEYDLPGLKTVNGIASLASGEKSAWFTDPDGNILSVSDEYAPAARKAA